MIKLVTIRIGIIVLIVAAILGGLMISTKMPNAKANGFTRNYLSQGLPILRSLTLSEQLTHISGISDSSIFITGENPTAILMLDKSLTHKDTFSININIPIDKIVPSSLYIDPPMLYLHVNNMKAIIYGKFPGETLDIIEVKSQIFTKSVQISPSTCIIRGFHSSVPKQVFQKIDLKTGTILEQKSIIDSITSASDGIASDGILCYDPKDGKVIYVEYLSNKFYCIDTNLNLIYKSRTIDTISSSNVVMNDIKQSDGKIKKVPSLARIKVNEYCFTDSANIYIVSSLKADNESLPNFNRKTVIDIYKMSSGQYKGSISLSKNDRKFKSAAIKNDTLVALYDHEIILYKLNKLKSSFSAKTGYLQP